MQHLAGETEVGEDPEEALEHDYDDTGQHVDTDAPSSPPGDADDGAVGDTTTRGSRTSSTRLAGGAVDPGEEDHD